MNTREAMTTDIPWVAPASTVAEAAELVRSRRWSLIPVCEDERLVGVVTDRDFARWAVTDGVDPAATKVAQMMSRAVAVSEEDELERAVEVMEELCVRHLPVIDPAGHLTGLVALSDVSA